MKAIKLITIVFVVTVLLGVVATAEAILFEGPLSETEFYNIVNNEPLYGPPPAASFPNGPTSILNSGTQDLIAGPDPGQTQKISDSDVPVEYLLFVISFDPILADVPRGSVEFSLTTDFDPSTTLEFLGAASTTDDFFSNDDIGFPDNIEGIGHGEVGGVKFPNALHGAVLTGLPFVAGTKDPEDVVGSVGVTTDIFNLRIDIFSLILENDGNNGLLLNSNGITYSDLRIVGNNPNSHSLAVVPEPATMLLLGSGLIGFAVIGRRKIFKKK